MKLFVLSQSFFVSSQNIELKEGKDRNLTIREVYRNPWEDSA